MCIQYSKYVTVKYHKINTTITSKEQDRYVDHHRTSQRQYKVEYTVALKRNKYTEKNEILC